MLETKYQIGKMQFEGNIMKGNIEKIKIEKGPHYTLVNPKTNLVYVSNNKSNVISVIDGTSIIESISIEKPRQIAVNPEQNKIYVISGYATGKYHDEGGQITIIDGATNKIIDSIDVFEGISGIAVNSVTNQIFGSLSNLKTIFVIDGSTNKITDKIELIKDESANEKKGFFKKLTSGEAKADSQAGKVYNNIEVNSNTNQVYVANPLTNQIFVIDVASKTIKDKLEVPMPFDVHFNPKNGLLYIIEREFFEYNETST